MYSQNSNFSSNNFQQSTPMNYSNSNDERLIGGGFAFPFLLGGVTGAALAPNFWGRPPYYNNNYYYPPYPPYRPYPPYPPYRPYR